LFKEKELQIKGDKMKKLSVVIILGLLCLLTGGKAYAECVQPPLGLIGWWPGDGNANDIVDGNHGTLQGGASFGTGLVGQAFSFDGIDDFVQVPDSDLWAFTSDFAIEMWVNFNSDPGGTLIHPGAIFISNSEGGGQLNKWSFQLGEGKLAFHINGPSINGYFLAQADFSPTLNQWYHLAVTRTGNIYTIYINGISAGSETNDVVIPNPNAPLTIGQGEGFFLDGLMDEVAIYNRSLSPSEIESIYNAGSEGKCKPDVTGCIFLKGSPLTNTKVILKQKREKDQITTIDINGYYKFDNVVSGRNFQVIINGPVVP